MKLTQPALFRARITPAMKRNLEEFAARDGAQRGFFFSTSGALCSEMVRATSTVHWQFKTQAGKPITWST